MTRLDPLRLKYGFCVLIKLYIYDINIIKINNLERIHPVTTIHTERKNHTSKHWHTYTQKEKHTHTPTYEHTQTHTYKHTHTHNNKHIHIQTHTNQKNDSLKMCLLKKQKLENQNIWNDYSTLRILFNIYLIFHHNELLNYHSSLLIEWQNNDIPEVII